MPKRTPETKGIAGETRAQEMSRGIGAWMGARTEGCGCATKGVARRAGSGAHAWCAREAMTTPKALRHNSSMHINTNISL